MNRIKVWVYALAVAAVAVVALRAQTLWLGTRAIADLDARLAAASAQATASARSLAREGSAAAAFAARDAKLVEALHAKEAAPAAPPPAKGRRSKPPPDPSPVDVEAQETALREAARGALAAAERSFGFGLPDGTAITAGNREWLARKGARGAAEGDAMAYLRGAIGGKEQRGYVRLNGALFQAAAAPAGEGAGIVVLVPLDDAWARGLAAASGAQVTISAPDVKSVSTAGGDAHSFAAWTRGSGVPWDVGQLAKTTVAIGPVKLPGVPAPSAAPAHRAQAAPLEGVKGGYVVLSVSAAPAFGAIAQSFWRGVLLVAALFVGAIVLGFLVRASESALALPEELLAAASRIERGDFAARVPPLAGQLGTVATALNRSAELAGPAAAAVTARASVTDEFFARGIAPEPAAPPPPAPRPAAPEPEPEPAPARDVAPAPELLQAAAAVPAAPAELDEEGHWKQVFQEFLRTRASCGEQSEGLSYDKFRLKLEGNRAALATKYGCKTVKFQVYVKDGKAALKATPVK